VEGFNEGDRERARELEAAVKEIATQLVDVRRGQRVSLKRMRRLPDITATAIVRAVGKRALLLIGIGIGLGSLLGGAGFEVARKLVVSVLAGIR
jgi:hypothetical protein